MTVEIKTLSGVTIDKMFKTWMKAFSDYQVDLKMTPEILDIYFRQNCVDFSASVGAFEGDDIVGFWMNGLREFGGIKSAYDSGTAIWPEYRGKGISTKLAQYSSEILKKLGVAQYQLEVLQDNEKAYKVYLKDGFCVSRDFLCMKKQKVGELCDVATFGYDIVTKPYDPALVGGFPKMEYVPSWQNADIAMSNIKEEVISLSAVKDGVVKAYGLMQPKRGRISQIAFTNDLWDTNFPAAFLNKLASTSGTGEAVVINIDTTAVRTAELFEKTGFSVLCKQYEMKKKI